MALLELDDVKTHLSIELEDTSFDNLIDGYIAAAERACELRTGRWINPADAPAGSKAAPFSATDLDVLRHAARLMVGEWFACRENSAAGASPQMHAMPLAVGWLLEPLRDIADR